jgi:hypothetical protein
MAKIEQRNKQLYETYSTYTDYKDGTVFVSHNGLDDNNRVSVVLSRYSFVLYLSNDEATAIANMLTDAVESRTKEEE